MNCATPSISREPLAWLHLILAVAAALVVANAAHAADVITQSTLSLDGAKSVAMSALHYARAHNAPGAAVAVVDAGGVVIYVERLDGTFLNASNISIGKARTAVLFGKPTRVFEDLVNKGRYTMLALPEIAPFTPLMGGVPIEIGGRVVGAIGVSGAASAAQDDEIATAGASEFAKTHQTLSQVQYVPNDKVAEGFRKDATLVSDNGYRVNSSRRDGPGEAEVHALDTDIFYVIEGSASVITGGEVIEPRTIAVNETRGKGIQGGTEYKLGKGDVLTIPRGTPHWFKEVKTPFRYYVVKASG